MSTFTDHFPHLTVLLSGYSTVCRAVVQPYHYHAYIQRHTDYAYDPVDTIVREPLIEHVGMLPILATYLHPFLDVEVDLGITLKMLAIHDIGEVITGDISVFNKKGDEGTSEKEAALSLLHPSQHDIYHAYLAQETNEAKFAKSIDKLAPDLYDMLTDYKITSVRLACFTNNTPEEIPNLLRTHKTPYMLWNPFLQDFHAGLIKKLEEMYQINL